MDPSSQSINATFTCRNQSEFSFQLCNHLGKNTLNIILFEKSVLNTTSEFLKYLINRNQQTYLSHACDSVLELCGTRSFLYRLFLGLVPAEGVGAEGTQQRGEFVQSLAAYRQAY